WEVGRPEEDDLLSSRQHVAKEWLIEPCGSNRTSRIGDERLEDFETGPARRSHAAARNPANDCRHHPRPERRYWLEAAAILVADWKAVQQVFYRDQPDALQVGGATGPDTFKILQRRRQHVFVHRAGLLNDNGSAGFHLDFADPSR